MIEGEGDPENYAFNTYNISIIGNANRNEIVDSENNLIYAGGVIFQKTWGVTLNSSNVLSRAFFISYLITHEEADEDGIFYTAVANLDYIKAYDSFQNVGFLWGGAVLNISNSIIQRAGGPAFLLQHEDASDNTTIDLVPMVNIVNSDIVTEVSGDEVWFAAVGASAQATMIKNLSQVTTACQMGSFTKQDGDKLMMNLVAVCTSTGSTMMSNLDAQGYVSITNGNKVSVLSRITDTAFAATGDAGLNAVTLGSTIKQVNQATAPNVPPIFNASSATELCAFNGSTVINPLTGQQIGADTVMAFMASEYLTINYGGLAIMVEFYR
jgi:hypothetical protein